MRTQRLLLFTCSITLGLIFFQPWVIAQNRERIIHTFKNDGVDGNTPGALRFGPGGDLYGSTTYGGTYDAGTVFKLHRAGGVWNEAVLYEFPAYNGIDASYPVSSLLFDAAGNIYGTGNQGGAFIYYGALYKLAPNGDGTYQESVVYSFNNTESGFYPGGKLVMNEAGAIFGVGSSLDLGGEVVWELSPQSDGSYKLSVIFDSADYISGLATDDAGNLYGGTTNTIFQLSPVGDGTYKHNVLYTLTQDQGSGVGLLTRGPTGTFFGSAGGGKTGFGSVFKLENVGGTWVFTTLWDFKANRHDGIYPSSVIADKDLNLYGTTSNSGRSAGGVVFRLTRQADGSYVEDILHAFVYGSAEGWYPGGVVSDQNGGLYGGTLFGGCCGTIYQLKTK